MQTVLRQRVGQRLHHMFLPGQLLKIFGAPFARQNMAVGHGQNLYIRLSWLKLIPGFGCLIDPLDKC